MEYEITNRERTTFLDVRGHAVDGYRVWFKMEDGTPDYVEIEKGQYTTENVKKAIEETITRHLEVVGG